MLKGDGTRAGPEQGHGTAVGHLEELVDGPVGGDVAHRKVQGQGEEIGPLPRAVDPAVTIVLGAPVERVGGLQHLAHVADPSACHPDLSFQAGRFVDCHRAWSPERA